MAKKTEESDHCPNDPSMTRRQLLGMGGVLAVGGSLAAAMKLWQRNEGGQRAEVFIGQAPDYRADLAEIIGEGLTHLGVTRTQIRGKRILLKPNLVETAIGWGHINTHPAVVVAAAESFRRLDAGEVIVAEGQGHRRDSRLVLDESGMGEALDAAGLSFVDLNHDQTAPVANVGNWTDLSTLYLPAAVLTADVVVSLPKLKTHHWTGVTCAMKNMFGVMPGVLYGWPKNVLHRAGIHKSILDVNAAVTGRPAGLTGISSLAIVDGIVGMEGDGPIMGPPKPVGCLVMGRNFPAVDATCARIMDLKPGAIRYLAGASGRLGPIQEHNIQQRGELIQSLRTPFALLDLPHLKNIR